MCDVCLSVCSLMFVCVFSILFAMARVRLLLSIQKKNFTGHIDHVISFLFLFRRLAVIERLAPSSILIAAWCVAATVLAAHNTLERLRSI